MEAPVIQIDTSMGSFQVELYYKHAPKATKNFEELAKRGYYDGTIVSALCFGIHRSDAVVLNPSTQLRRGEAVAKLTRLDLLLRVQWGDICIIPDAHHQLQPVPSLIGACPPCSSTESSGTSAYKEATLQALAGAVSPSTGRSSRMRSPGSSSTPGQASSAWQTRDLTPMAAR